MEERGNTLLNYIDLLNWRGWGGGRGGYNDINKWNKNFVFQFFFGQSNDTYILLSYVHENSVNPKQFSFY